MIYSKNLFIDVINSAALNVVYNLSSMLYLKVVVEI